MKVGIPREVRAGERRVAAPPEAVSQLVKKLGFEVLVEEGAGSGASFPDEQYREAGATLLENAREVWSQADLVLKVQPPERHPKLEVHEAELLRDGATLVSFLWPAKNKELLDMLAAKKATVIGMDQIPRITRAQKMDALSTMANIAGYRAVIEAASFFGRFFTGQMTAAGRVPPAKVLVIGAGVAGLAAIGAARGLGAIVRAFDTRPVVREQVQSMGAEFIEVSLAEDGTGEGGYAKEMSDAFLEAERKLFLEQAGEVDIIITTALVPGRPAPVLLTKDIVETMRPGSVIVDLAAEAGGNCEVTQPEQVVGHKGVTVIGYVDLPSRLAPTASTLYGNNLVHLLTDMGGSENWHIDHEDEVVRGALVLENGELRWPPPKRSAPPATEKRAPVERPSLSAPAEKALARAETERAKVTQAGRARWLVLAALAAIFSGLGLVAPAAFLSHLTVFVLACFVGWQVVWNVTPALHTPLMSVTNAISGIIIIGGMVGLGSDWSAPATLLGAVAVLVATINISGGFLVTQRMLKMFRK